MLFDLLSALRLGDANYLKFAITSVLLALPIILLALCVHEMAHGFIANKLGDPTAKYMGRLTLNPLKHLDPFGFLAMLCFGFGWAKPVPINTRYFKKPRRDTMLCALAGPISNIILAFIFAAAYKLTVVSAGVNDLGVYIKMRNGADLGVTDFLVLLFSSGIWLNLGLAVFNLLPIPPLDGSKVLYSFLPPNAYFKMIQYEQYITIGFFVYLLLEQYLPIQIVSTLINFITEYICRLFDIILFFIK